jgi:uncharacterized protein YpmB
MSQKKRSDPFTIIVLLVFGLVISAVTLLVLYVYPVSILTCRYVETEQVDCQLQERMIGLVPVQEISIVNLKEAYVVSEVHEKRRSDRQIIDPKVYRMILSTDSGTVALESFDEFGGIFVEQTVDEINDFLLTHTDEPLRIWQATWVPLLVGSFFFLVSVLMLYVAVDSLIRGIMEKLR